MLLSRLLLSFLRDAGYSSDLVDGIIYNSLFGEKFGIFYILPKYVYKAFKFVVCFFILI